MSKEKEQLEKITKSIKEMSKQFNDITVCLHHLTKQMHELSEQIKDLKEKQSIIPSVWPIVTPNTGEQDWWKYTPTITSTTMEIKNTGDA